MLVALSLLAPALATPLVETWTYDAYRSGESMVGVDGWVGGFSDDQWTGYLGSSGAAYVQSTTDNNSGDYPGDWGSGAAIDNWLVNTDVSIEDGVVRVGVYSEDDDTLGLIFGFQDAENFYLLASVQASGSNPLGETGCILALVKVSAGSADLLAEAPDCYTTSTLLGLEIEQDDGLVTGRLWSAVDTSWADPDVEISAIDLDPLGPGAVGFYAYDSGGVDRAETALYFGAVAALQTDDDDDGVPDDQDNCESASNADQADMDADGEGDACDPDDHPDSGDPGDSGDTARPDSGEPAETGESGSSADTSERSDTSGADSADSDSGPVHDSEPQGGDSDSPLGDSDPGAGLGSVKLRGAYGCASAGGLSGEVALLLAALALLPRWRGQRR